LLIDMEIFVQRYYIIVFCIYLSLILLLYFWLNPQSRPAEDYTSWYLKHMLIVVIETIAVCITSRKVQHAFQRDYKLEVASRRLLVRVKAAPRVNHKVALIIVDLLHASICLWGMIIYW
jgi:hypothetical protein